MDLDWTIQHRAMLIFIYGAAGIVVSMLFWPFASESFKLRVDAFFDKMRTSVDSEKEIGVSRNWARYRMLGFFSVGILSVRASGRVAWVLFRSQPSGLCGLADGTYALEIVGLPGYNHRK